MYFESGSLLTNQRHQLLRIVYRHRLEDTQHQPEEFTSNACLETTTQEMVSVMGSQPWFRPFNLVWETKRGCETWSSFCSAAACAVCSCSASLLSRASMFWFLILKMLAKLTRLSLSRKLGSEPSFSSFVPWSGSDSTNQWPH